MFSLKWIRGRQDSGYQKIILLKSKLLKMDMSLIKYENGDFIPEHKDEVDNIFIHNRINILLRKAKAGGEFYCSKYKLFLNRIIFFQPSEEIHSVAKITQGSRYILSIGWLTKRNK